MLSTILSKKNGRFCEVSLFTFLLIFPVWKGGGLGGKLGFWVCKRSLFGGPTTKPPWLVVYYNFQRKFK